MLAVDWAAREQFPALVRVILAARHQLPNFKRRLPAYGRRN
jgi:hypothetical protein